MNKNFFHLKIIIIIFLFIKQTESNEKEKNVENEEEDDYKKIFSSNHINKYLWGTYKPNLYFSLKERKKLSDVFGIMWYDSTLNSPNNFNNYIKNKISEKLRHECSQKDKIKYYFNFHNGIDAANEILLDENNNFHLDIKYIKRTFTEQTQNWDAIISGKIINNDFNNNNKEISLILYFSLENYEISDKSFFKIDKNNDNFYNITGIKFGNPQSKFSINVEKGKILYSNFQKFRKKYSETWRVKQFVLNDLISSENDFKKINKTYSFLPFNELSSTKQPNIIAIQFSFNLFNNEDFIISIHYSNDLKEKFLDLNPIQNLIQEKEKEFNEKFHKIFPIPNEIQTNHEKISQMSKEALSNILGGIGYFYGGIQIDSSNNSKIDQTYQPSISQKGLFTGTPCRSYFARGFLWDEGFHNIIISKWDIALSMDILNSWLNTMSSNGWVPREQIRGFEAENQVPSEFILQNKNIANPPTLIFPINDYLIHYIYYYNVSKGEIELKLLMSKIYKKLKIWLSWYETTQKTIDDNNNINYNWFGRDSSHNYPSGLDDIPRAMLQNPKENHLDLLVWLCELTNTLKNLSTNFDIESIDYYTNEHKKFYNIIKNNLFDFKELHIYSDYLDKQFKKVSTEKFKRKVFPILWRGDDQCGKGIKNPIGTQAECNPYSEKNCCSEFGWCGNTYAHCKCEKCKISMKLEDRKEYKKLEETFNPHLSYINLFAIIGGIYDLENSKKDKEAFDNIINFLLDENELYSEFGIRSLSKNDLLYHTGDDYWRGNVWINLNYLTLRGLYKYYINKNEKAKEAYVKIRNNVIKTIYNVWEKTHTFYEQYSDINGNGTYNHPFNGWTSTVINIISEKYND